MGLLTVQVWDVTGNKRTEVEMPDDVPMLRILAVLLEKLSLPQTGANGEPMVYKTLHKTSGKQLNDEQSLADVGAKDGDVLVLLPELVPG